MVRREATGEQLGTAKSACCAPPCSGLWASVQGPVHALRTDQASGARCSPVRALSRNVAGECNCLRIDPRLREAPRGGTLLSSICKTQKRSRGKNGNASEAYAWHLPLSECLKCMANTGEECFLPS
eukprot:248066-Chlamydomonas_euryale.AAC.1